MEYYGIRILEISNIYNINVAMLEIESMENFGIIDITIDNER